MRVLYLTRCANKYSAYSDLDCKENLFTDGKFSFLQEKRHEAFKLLKAKNQKRVGLFGEYPKISFGKGFICMSCQKL